MIGNLWLDPLYVSPDLLMSLHYDMPLDIFGLVRFTVGSLIVRIGCP